MNDERESIHAEAGKETRGGRAEHRKEVTQLLVDWSHGDQAALEALTPIVYEKLRRLAHRYMQAQRRDHTLQTTALVNEAYLKMIDITQVSWQSKAHFIGVAANQMRRILVDHARKHNAEKRGGEFHILTLNEEIDKAAEQQSTELIELDDALNELASMDPTQRWSTPTLLIARPGGSDPAETLQFPLTLVAKVWL